MDCESGPLIVLILFFIL